MVQAENGQTMSLKQALALTDNTGKVLEWKQDEKTGQYSAQGTSSDMADYYYNINVGEAPVTISVTKKRKNIKEIVKVKNKINKTDIDADDIKVDVNEGGQGIVSYKRDLANVPVSEKEAKKEESQWKDDSDKNDKKTKKY